MCTGIDASRAMRIVSRMLPRRPIVYELSSRRCES
jgi:hypothetical protein